MTRDEAVKIWRGFGCQQTDAFHRQFLPQHIMDQASQLNAEDIIDGLMALGILKCEPPEVASQSPQETDNG